MRGQLLPRLEECPRQDRPRVLFSRLLCLIAIEAVPMSGRLIESEEKRQEKRREQEGKEETGLLVWDPHPDNFAMRDNRFDLSLTDDPYVPRQLSLRNLGEAIPYEGLDDGGIKGLMRQSAGQRMGGLSQRRLRNSCQGKI